jgi:hypothetical protein
VWVSLKTACWPRTLESPTTLPLLMIPATVGPLPSGSAVIVGEVGIAPETPVVRTDGAVDADVKLVLVVGVVGGARVVVGGGREICGSGEAGEQGLGGGVKRRAYDVVGELLADVRHYLESQEKKGLLTKKPLGWNNLETFLKNGPLNKREQQSCFSVNSMREFAVLPDEAYGIVTENRAQLQRLLAMNIEAEEPKMAPSAIAEMVLSFFSGLCIERNLKFGQASSTRKIENFMTALRGL